MVLGYGIPDGKNRHRRERSLSQTKDSAVLCRIEWRETFECAKSAFELPGGVLSKSFSEFARSEVTEMQSAGRTKFHTKFH